MLELILLRHAKTERPRLGQEDHDRELIERGYGDARLMAPHVLRPAHEPVLALCSTATRARQTLAALELPPEVEVRFSEELYLASASSLLRQLQALGAGASRVLLVGHNPGIEDLALALGARGPLEERRKLVEGMSTCSMARIEFDGEDWSAVELGEGRLVAFQRPKGLR